MARSRFNDPIEPMDLQNMRQNGVRSPVQSVPAHNGHERRPSPRRSHHALIRGARSAGLSVPTLKSWRTFETTASGHDVMVDAPEWLADILLQVS